MLCKCYHEDLMKVWDPRKYVDGWGSEIIGFCYGTKERERCYCKGNELECVYPEVVDKAKKETAEYKIKEAIELLKENGYIVYKEV